ncbi:MAG TPA: ferredoxin--NADP reductase [Myxococcota bacterium]|nr:ferredoxin--NADP reductase [Myxococcota bacterium]
MSYHPLRVREVIRETPDTLSYLLDVPAELAERFRYRAGQFLTFKVPVAEGELLRCYSLSSAPETDAAPTVTVKLVPGGRGSGWFHQHVSAGSTLQVMQPAGRFVLHESERPLLLFAGGSGVTPILSLIKAALTTTKRRIRLFYANRDAASVIFRAEFDALARRYDGRLETIHHLDDELGLTSRSEIERTHAGFEQADAYLCGPGPFMELVEQVLLARGHSRDHLWIERFEGVGEPSQPGPGPAATGPAPSAGGVPGEVVVHLDKTVHRIRYAKGLSLLAAARKAGLAAPFACEEGYCGSCAAKCLRGKVTMLANDVFTPEEVGEGWILTCQGHAEGDECEISWDV